MYIFFICTSLRSVFLGFTSQRKNCSRVRIRQIHRTECVLDCAYISRRTGSQEDSIFYHHDCRKLVSFKALNRKKITNGYKVGVLHKKSFFDAVMQLFAVYFRFCDSRTWYAAVERLSVIWHFEKCFREWLNIINKIRSWKVLLVRWRTFAWSKAKPAVCMLNCVFIDGGYQISYTRCLSES